MSNEKKFIFTAQDGGVTQKVNQIYSGITAKAKEYSNSLKEQTSFIEKQIKELEKKARLEGKTGNAILRENENLLRHSRTYEERDRYQGRVDRVRSELGEKSAVIDLLKELLAETKRQSTSIEKTEKDYKKKIIFDEERDKSEYVDNNTSNGVKIFEEEKVNKRKNKEGEDCCCCCCCDESHEDIEKSGSGGGKGKDKGIFSQVFAGTLAAGIVQKIGNSLGTIASSQTGEQAFNSLLGGIPFVGDLFSGANQRKFEEQYTVGFGTNKLKALTGNRNLNIRGNTDIGFSTRENVESATNLITASGNSGGYDKYGNQARLMERGLGLSPQTITQIVKDIRTTQSNADITKIAADVIRSNPELRRDQTKFSEILSQTSQLTNQLASQTENNNLSTNAGIVGQLRGIGGSFADPVLGSQRMLSINQSLTNPGNDFQKARSFGVLSGINPGSSYFQLQEMQEKGVGQKGYLEGILKQLEKEVGGGENLMLAAQQNLNIPFSSARKLIEARDKNKGLLTNFSGGTEDVEKFLNISGRARDFTADKDREAARTSDAFLDGAFAGFVENLNQTGQTILKASTDFSINMFGLSQEISNNIRTSLGLKPGGGYIKTNPTKGG